jgi:succinate dehydrogenase / fumarate reductase iron-sulfur subunit
MKFTLHIWRQKNTQTAGGFVTYLIENIKKNTSFLEMLDLLNERLIVEGKDCVVFDHDCREGICGACSLVINAYPHGKKTATTTCQLYMREYQHQDELWIEPWRARSFPMLKDLSVDRSTLDGIIQAGGYVGVSTGNASEVVQTLIAKPQADEAFNAAACIGCGACVAACPNASATLFVAAKVTHLDLLPQGKIESKKRIKNMLKSMEAFGFGSCSNHRHCESVCPKKISLSCITVLNQSI